MAVWCNITFEELTDYVDGRCSPEAANQLRAHIESGCRACKERTAFLMSATAGLTDALESEAAGDRDLPSESSRIYARGLARRLSIASTETTPIQIPSFRHWFARLVADTASSLSGSPTVALAGVRAAATVESSSQRLYETEAHLITLWEERRSRDEGSYVIGQIYGREDGVCRAPESVLFTATMNGAVRNAMLEEGEFHAAHLPTGMYLLQCWLADNEGVVVLPGVQIGASGSR